MPRTAGTYSLPPSYKATSGQTIRTEQHNPPLEDIAQALTDSLPRDGSAAMTGNLPMNGKKVTGLGAGTSDADAVRRDQVTLYSAWLAALAGLSFEANKLPYATGAGTAALTNFTEFARSLLDDADAATARDTLGLKVGATTAKAGWSEAVAGTDDTKFMTPLRTKQAIAEQVDVSGSMASASAFSVGSYAFLRAIAGGAFDGGDTTVGGNLSPSDANGKPVSLSPGAVTTLPGVWRCMGRTDTASFSTGNAPNQATLWLRIS